MSVFPCKMAGTMDPILLALREIVSTSRAAATIAGTLTRVVRQLETSTGPMAWEVIPLATFGGALPETVRSCWIFVIRAGAATSAERHPNSHQRSFSLVGHGTFELHDGARWLAHALVSNDAGGAERWVSIPPSTWHRLVVGPRTWGMVSFHTVTPEELIEEKPVNPDDLDGPTHQERYAQR